MFLENFKKKMQIKKRIIGDQYIKELRKVNKNNPNYPKLFWNGVGVLYVKVGDFENSSITPNEALKLFKKNKLFMAEYKNLMNYYQSDRNDYQSDKNDFFKQQSQFVEEGIKEEFSNLVRENNKGDVFKPQQFDIEVLKKENEESIQQIISELDLIKSDDVMVQLKNCCLVQKYIVEHIMYTSNIMDEKKEYPPEYIRIIDLHNAVVKNIGVCTSNSILFQEILERIGINVKCVGLKSSEGGYHLANLVELAGEYYFFDSTLEKSIYDIMAKSGKDLILCCAGLGSKEYCQFYIPQVIVPKNPLEEVEELPKNISNARIPQEIVNMQILASKDKGK